MTCLTVLPTGVATCCFWDGCNGDANKATRSKDDFEKFLLEKHQKLEKFNSDAQSDKVQKEIAFSEKVFAGNVPTTSQPTARQGFEARPGKFATVGGKPFNKFAMLDEYNDGDEEVVSDQPKLFGFEILVTNRIFITKKQGYDGTTEKTNFHDPGFDSESPKDGWDEPPKYPSNKKKWSFHDKVDENEEVDENDGDDFRRPSFDSNFGEGEKQETFQDKESFVEMFLDKFDDRMKGTNKKPPDLSDGGPDKENADDFLIRPQGLPRSTTAAANIDPEVTRVSEVQWSESSTLKQGLGSKPPLDEGTEKDEDESDFIVVHSEDFAQDVTNQGTEKKPDDEGNLSKPPTDGSSDLESDVKEASAVDVKSQGSEVKPDQEEPDERTPDAAKKTPQTYKPTFLVTTRPTYKPTFMEIRTYQPTYFDVGQFYYDGEPNKVEVSTESTPSSPMPTSSSLSSAAQTDTETAEKEPLFSVEERNRQKTTLTSVVEEETSPTSATGSSSQSTEELSPPTGSTEASTSSIATATTTTETEVTTTTEDPSTTTTASTTAPTEPPTTSTTIITSTTAEILPELDPEQPDADLADLEEPDKSEKEPEMNPQGGEATFKTTQTLLTKHQGFEKKPEAGLEPATTTERQTETAAPPRLVFKPDLSEDDKTGPGNPDNTLESVEELDQLYPKVYGAGFGFFGNRKVPE